MLTAKGYMACGKRPEAYIAANNDGTYDAFVADRGFRANATLPECCEFIRKETGRTQGAVAFFDRVSGEWDSEIDLGA